MSNRPLQRRHFEAIAAGIKAANAEHAAAEARGATVARSIGVAPRITPPPFLKADAERVADLLGGTNPRFQRDRFVAACGFGTWKATRRKSGPDGRLVGSPPRGTSWQADA